MPFDYAKPATRRQNRIAWSIMFVLFIGIFVLIPPLVRSFDPIPAPVPEEVPPSPPPANATVSVDYTYATLEQHNVRVAITVTNTGTQTASFTVTLETATTYSIITVWDVPAGKSGSDNAYVATKDGDYFVKNQLPDPPLVVTDIFEFVIP